MGVKARNGDVVHLELSDFSNFYQHFRPAAYREKDLDPHKFGVLSTRYQAKRLAQLSIKTETVIMYCTFEGILFTLDSTHDTISNDNSNSELHTIFAYVIDSYFVM